MRNSGINSLLVSLATLLALWAAPAQAAPCGDTSGVGGANVPCNCGDTVTTNTVIVLSDPVRSTGVSDVCPGPGPALSVAGGVTLDIAGLTIRCASNTGTQVGILITGNGAVVRKGIIQNCGIGIGGTTASSRIESNRLLNDRVGVELTGDGNTLDRNNATGNTISSADGFVIMGNSNVIRANRCANHLDDGLAVTGNSNQLDKNYCLGNGGDGIVVSGTSNLLTRNLGKNNGGHGIIAPGPGNFTDGNNFASGNDLKPDCSINGQSSADGRYC